MDMNNEKLQKFIDAVNSEIENKVNDMLAEAEAEKKSILDEAERESQEAAEKHLNVNSKKNENRFVRDISKAELNMKKEVLQHRDELTAKVFAVVEQKIAEYRGTPKYVDMLIKKLLLIQVTEGSEIYLSPEDMKYADTLKKAIRAENVTFLPDEKIRLGGISVYNKQKGVISDKTFDLAVEEQKRIFTNSNAFAQ
ncbi:MAG: hypothetical protein J6C96_10315 [Oscillospiraceae bacterium]|nr:hypothetical protein [Oscillospiraceae bacterium]